MQPSCCCLCWYLLQGTMQTGALTSYSPLIELSTHKTAGNNVLLVKINRQLEKQFLSTEGLIKHKSPLSVLGNWRLTIGGWSTPSKMDKSFYFYFLNLIIIIYIFLRFPKYLFSWQQVPHYSVKGNMTSVNNFPFLSFLCVCVYVYNTVLKALCSWLSSEWLPIASESTTPSWTHRLAPWDYLLVKTLHALSQSDTTLWGKCWVWLWHFGKWVMRGDRNTTWQVEGCVLWSHVSRQGSPGRPRGKCSSDQQSPKTTDSLTERQHNLLDRGFSWRQGSREYGNSGKGMIQILLKSTEELIDFSGLSSRPKMFTS